MRHLINSCFSWKQFYFSFIFCICICSVSACVCMHACLPRHTRGGQRTTFWNQLSPRTMLSAINRALVVGFAQQTLCPLSHLWPMNDFADLIVSQPPILWTEWRAVLLFVALSWVQLLRVDLNGRIQIVPSDRVFDGPTWDSSNNIRWSCPQNLRRKQLSCEALDRQRL